MRRLIILNMVTVHGPFEVEEIWRAVERASVRTDVGVPRRARAVLARRELLQREARALRAVIRRGIDSGAF